MLIEPLPIPGDVRTIVFSFDDAYARYFSVTLASLIAHAREGCIYDIVVFHDGISERSMNMLQSMVPNTFSLRFFNVDSYASEALGNLGLKISSAQWSIATFYSLLVPLLMPGYERVLYSDCDLVFCADPGELFEMPFDGAQLIAVRDTLAITMVIDANSDFVRRQVAFLDEYLDMRSYETYFNGGILVFDIPSIEHDAYLEHVRHALAFPELPTVDQEVLNYVFRDRVRLAPQRFNVQAHLLELALAWEGEDPLVADYLAAAANPAVVHYTTKVKPWRRASCALGEYFWEYAPRSPYLEALTCERDLMAERYELGKFNVRSYLKYWLLSKLAIGPARQRYLEEYQEQRRLNVLIHSNRQ